MIDPVRPEVSAAIEQCHSAGIRPIMITGDHLDTAVAIAKELGMRAGTVVAPSPWWLLPTFYVRELYGLLYQIFL